MSDYHIALPSKPRIVSETERGGTYEVDGLFPGYGYTLGNSLRRILLSSLPGAAVTHVKIPGVSHEFSTIEGVKEDVVTILLNIRKLRFKISSDEPQTIILSAKGPAVITAADLTLPGQVEILNPDQYIAEITGKVSLEIELRAEKGLGYIPKEQHQKERVDIGTIALDAIFSPIRRVNYEVENMRVGDRTDFNRLRILIETDGTLAPREALERSIETMIHQLKAVVGFKEEEEPEAPTAQTESRSSRDEKAAALDAEMLKTRITELKLPQRVEMALDNDSIRTVGGLVRKREDDLLAARPGKRRGHPRQDPPGGERSLRSRTRSGRPWPEGLAGHQARTFQPWSHASLPINSLCDTTPRNEHFTARNASTRRSCVRSPAHSFWRRGLRQRSQRQRNCAHSSRSLSP